MNKKGKLVMNQVITGLLMLVVVIGALLVVTQLLKGTKKGVEGALPEKEGLVEKVWNFMIGENLELKAQQKKADKIRNVIQSTIDRIGEGSDCIEEIDFTDVDKSFIAEFGELNGKTRLAVYKIIKDYWGEKQPGQFFDYNFEILIYYFSEGGYHRDKEFKIINELREVEHGNERIVWFLYKDKDGRIGFFSKDVFDEGFKYKQFCSSGEYSIEILEEDDLGEYDKIVILGSRHTVDSEEADLVEFKKNIDTYARNVDPEIGFLGWWYRKSELLKEPPLTLYQDGPMVSIINNARRLKFKVELIDSDSVRLPREECEEIISVIEQSAVLHPILYITYIDKAGKRQSTTRHQEKFECGNVIIDPNYYYNGLLQSGDFDINEYYRKVPS